MKPPALCDWRGKLDKLVESTLPTREGMTEIIHLCDELLEEIDPAVAFVNEQRGSISRLRNQYQEIYNIRFHEAPPARSPTERGEVVLLETPETRRQAVREAALELAAPGDEITDAGILAALKGTGKQLAAENPTATISTILNGFKSHFEKVQGKRGVFRRR